LGAPTAIYYLLSYKRRAPRAHRQIEVIDLSGGICRSECMHLQRAPQQMYYFTAEQRKEFHFGADLCEECFCALFRARGKGEKETLRVCSFAPECDKKLQSIFKRQLKVLQL